MKSRIALSIMIVCMCSLCMGQTTVSPTRSLDLDVGTTKTFEFYNDGTYIGYNTYTVTKKDVYNEKDAYFIESTVELQDEIIDLYLDASYIIDTQGACLHYEFDAVINGETHTMNADFTVDSVHITGSRPGTDYDKIISLGQQTFSLDNNLIGQWDIVFSSVVLEKGGTFAVNFFGAQHMKVGSVRADIYRDLLPVQAAGKSWECFKLEFQSPTGYIMYVTESGQLVKLENGMGIEVTLKELS